MLLPNADHRLKPGMFIRAAIVLDRVDDATVIPAQSLTRRDDQDGIFIVSDDGLTVRWQPVRIGIRADDRVQLLDNNLTGRVVTLGQQMVDDGVSIVIPDNGQAHEGAAGG
jgi:multidrug efflux pump subunit AcrA (membrane-fusion protein)